MNLTVNGMARSFDGDPEMPLLWYLRDELGLTGAKFGCGAGLCGACVVHIDGVASFSCVTPMTVADGSQVVTIEGLSPDGTHPVQAAWQELNVAQCGYCQAGQIMQAAALLAETPAPTDEDIDSAMSQNICRCGTYPRIRAAIKRAAGQEAR
ncbi:(2Fe-2S)-binding protein [Paracoccus salipaludis]|nr:(2Fe-2S)-binding protein [Paracoccus salipaludis]